MQLITEEYRKLNEQLHNERLDYGSDGQKWLEEITNVAQAMETKDILDYGCGKGTLSMHLPFMIKQYDPAIPRFADMPEPADLVVCTDVLEHIEPELIGNVLEHIRSLSQKGAFLVIHTEPSLKNLPDGRNAHILQEPPRWWFNAVSEFFQIMYYRKVPAGVIMAVEPLPKRINGKA